jgi:hypothetical protein
MVGFTIGFSSLFGYGRWIKKSPDPSPRLGFQLIWPVEVLAIYIHIISQTSSFS